jgi:hypothetical protein
MAGLIPTALFSDPFATFTPVLFVTNATTSTVYRVDVDTDTVLDTTGTLIPNPTHMAMSAGTHAIWLYVGATSFNWTLVRFSLYNPVVVQVVNYVTHLSVAQMTVSDVYQCGQLFQPGDDYFLVKGFMVSRSYELFLTVQESTSLRTISLKWGLASGFTCYGYNDTTAFFGGVRIHSMSASYDYRFMFYQANQSMPVYMAPLGGMDFVPGFLFQVVSSAPTVYLTSNATLAAVMAFAKISTTAHGYTAVVIRRSRVEDGESAFRIRYFDVLLFDHNGDLVSRTFLYTYENDGVTVTTDVPTFLHLSSFGDLFTVLSSGSVLRTSCRTRS